MDLELSECGNGCGVAIFNQAAHDPHCPSRPNSDVDARRAGELIDEFLASVDCYAIDRDILNGSVDEPFNTAAVIERLRGTLRG